MSFDLTQETLDLTTLGNLTEGDLVNVERSAKMGQENGGHGISGHVDTKAVVDSIDDQNNNWVATLKWQRNGPLTYF